MNQIKKASEFFSSRRSVSVRNLKYPGPSEKQIMDILKSALRVPDHGKLEPWRIVLITEDNKKSYISMIELKIGTMGVEPMISSARGWQYTKLTYVPIGR